MLSYVLPGFPLYDMILSILGEGQMLYAVSAYDNVFLAVDSFFIDRPSWWRRLSLGSIYVAAHAPTVSQTVLSRQSTLSLVFSFPVLVASAIAIAVIIIMCCRVCL